MDNGLGHFDASPAPVSAKSAPKDVKSAPKEGPVAAPVAADLSVLPRVAEGGTQLTHIRYTRTRTRALGAMVESAATACHLPPNQSDPETITIILRPEPGWSSTPFPVRLRRCLKVMLRSFGLRCVSITSTAANTVTRGLP